MTTIPLLLLDFYKCTHAEQLSADMAYLVSYYTARMSRIKGQDYVINFGLQYFCKHYLIDTFNKYFFELSEDEVMQQYESVLDATMGEGSYNSDKIRALHQLGYLPLELAEIPEGTKVPIKVPMIQIKNTHPDFAWLTNTIESLMSATLWHIQVSANVGYEYRQIVNRWYGMTVDEASVNEELCVNKAIPSARSRALGDFSYRGQHSNESAAASSSAFCLSFVNTATVPAQMWLSDFYGAKLGDIKGAISTEHSVMCSNYAIDGDERTLVKRLLTEVYPNHSFSMVSDSYDYWNMVTNILPSLYDEIMNHNGTLLVRGDSGDPIDIICGIERNAYKSFKELKQAITQDSWLFTPGRHFIFRVADKDYTIIITEDRYDAIPYETSPENKGTVELLWETFGGTINSKGYKVLDKHIKVIYGDSITQQRAKEIYRRLKKKGFSAENVVLGVGSFSFMCRQDAGGTLQPYTRDTYGIAVKATYGELKDGTPLQIFKNPVTDTGNFKKSQKGMCYVCMSETGEISYMDEFTSASLPSTGNLLEPVFRDGKMVREFTLEEIRNRLHDGAF